MISPQYAVTAAHNTVNFSVNDTIKIFTVKHIKLFPETRNLFQKGLNFNLLCYGGKHSYSKHQTIMKKKIYVVFMKS